MNQGMKLPELLIQDSNVTMQATATRTVNSTEKSTNKNTPRIKHKRAITSMENT